MKRKGIFLATILATIIFVLCSGANAQSFKVGSTLENFKLTDLSGKEQTLDNLKGEKGTVIVFLSAQCPVVRGYTARINQIAEEYQSKGINFIGINSNATESLEWIKSNASEVGYKFPVLIDKDAMLADKLGATATPEAFYFDKQNVLLYQGAIDNDRSGKNITTNYLKAAFDSSLMGKKIEQTSAKAFGCSIKRKAE